LLQRVSDAYADFDAGRLLAERALELSSLELRAANAELRGVLQALPDLLFRIRSDDKICDVMQGTAVLEHPALRNLRMSCSPDDPSMRTLFWEAVRKVRETHSPAAFEYSDGSLAWMSYYELRLLPFVDRDIIGVIRDVTERQRAETALRESEERSALAQQAGRVGVFDWNLVSDRVFWSGESEEIFGLVRGTFSGDFRTWRERVAPEDRAQLETFFQEWLRSGRADDQCEYRILHPDRQERWVETKGHVFRDVTDQPVRIVGTNLDVTARRHAEKDRLILGKLESTGILAGGIAHDFNNLLAGILIDLDIVESNQCSPEDLAISLLDARHAVLSAKILTQQLITFSHGGASIRKPTHLAGLLRESAPLALSGSNVRSSILLPQDLWPVEVDVGQIGQVIRNLVLNAREAMPGGGVVHLRADNVLLKAGEGVPLPPGDYVRIRVADEGCGIPPDVLPKIFDPYFSTKMRSTQKGMGLGLTICHSVVQKHNGAITVESMPGIGSKFDVYLPASRHLRIDMRDDKPQTAQRSGRILVMDDEPVVRTNLGRILKQMGYEPELAADGEIAVEIYNKAKEEDRRFDAVLLDLTVRGAMGGHQAVQALLEIDPEVRAVVMSGHSDDDVMRGYASYGFRGALTKPFDRKALADVLARVLGALAHPPQRISPQRTRRPQRQT